MLLLSFLFGIFAVLCAESDPLPCRHRGTGLVIIPTKPERNTMLAFAHTRPALHVSPILLSSTTGWISGEVMARLLVYLPQALKHRECSFQASDIRVRERESKRRRFTTPSTRKLAQMTLSSQP
ncbi:hypothetical protein K469DRAFT_718440 [Zopfia rhizophila CBS 207.26]|uniref:Secreted protein n=1 Tax=Zopfia rhizophila CBS 207.26 TaxID=1314779 RepID=A0A6A6DIU8_9PEZI|nr:hypothetical protein K469DRAFT_718440 [Zopfia rhizophila CBS 207.26]